MSLAELREQCEKVLCYNCNDKFSPGHRCKKLFLIVAVTTEEEDEVDMDLVQPQELESHEISLHAISGDHALDTMKVVSQVQETPMTVLFDSGSSHNFISESLARQLELYPVTSLKVRVMIALREKLTSKDKCIGVSIKLRNFLTQVDFYIIPLEGYDVVLRTQWL